MLGMRGNKFILARNVLLVSSFVFCFFFLIFNHVVPVNVDNMGGTHSWLSGSTIKFVNYWLEEGAGNLNFTNYEAPNSIEFETLEEREPYLSYPTGETFFVYITAKLMGKSRITVSFLHKFQLALFCIEAILFSIFSYLFLAKTVRLKSDFLKILTATMVGILWMILPTCAYYLTNIYFADQSVILWIMGIVIVEYIIRVLNFEKKGLLILKTLRAIVLYTGMLIDYYFWFLAFFLFIFEFINVFLTKKKGKRRKELLSILMWFGMPVMLAIFTFYLQLVQTNGWMSMLIDRFNVRVVGREVDTLSVIVSKIGENFQAAFSLHDTMAIYLFIIIVLLFMIGVVSLFKKKKIYIIIKNPGISVVSANILAIIVQIIFFKQHSAIHEFSMIKIGWMVAFLPIIIVVVVGFVLDLDLCNEKKIFGKRVEKFFLCFVPAFLIVVALTGVPASTIEFTDERVVRVEYSFEELINSNTKYNDVLFSYTDEILKNPPQQLAISNKLLYRVHDISDIEDLFPHLSLEATKILVVNYEKGLADEQKSQLECLTKNKKNKERLKEGNYLLLELNNTDKCNGKDAKK